MFSRSLSQLYGILAKISFFLVNKSGSCAEQADMLPAIAKFHLECASIFPLEQEILNPDTGRRSLSHA